MDITINTHHLGRKGTAEYVPYPHLKKAGWKTLSYGYNEIENEILKSDKWLDYAKSVKETYDEYGFICTQTHLPCYEILLDSSVILPEYEEMIKRGIIIESILGAKWGVLHLRTATDHKSDVEIAYKHNKEFVLRLLDTAHKYNVGIAIENMPYYRDAWFNLFGTDYHDLNRLADEINDPLLGICYDFGHGILCGDDAPIAIKEIGHRLKATHVHNNNNTNDDLHNSPSRGILKWEPVAKALSDINYDNSISIEIDYPVEEIFAESYFRHMRECAEIIMNMVEKEKTN